MSKIKDNKARDCYGNDLTLIIAARAPARMERHYRAKRRYRKRYARIKAARGVV